jgi:hypothetical protein
MLLHLLTVGFGTKRTYQDVRLLVRFRAKADMHSGAALAASVAFDPSLPFDDQFCCNAQRGIPVTMW